MACKRGFSEEDFTCPVCCDVFKDPVLLSCGHSACSNCVQRYWDVKGYRECPLCRKRSALDPAVNLALKNLCQTFQKVRGDPETLCDIHREKLKLFCVDDRQVACLVCRDSNQHPLHRFLPVDEAASEQKRALVHGLGQLKLNMKRLEDAHFYCHRNIDHIKEQAKYIKTQINEKIQELVQFLKKENVALESRLEVEVRAKVQVQKNNIKNIRQKIQAISNTIGVIKKDLDSDDIKFLKHDLKKYLRKHHSGIQDQWSQDYCSFFPRSQDRDSDPTGTPRETCHLAKDLDPKMVSIEVIDVAKYLGNLQFRVWNKMQTTIKYTPVVLDPNTAHPQLILSPDLTSIRDSDDDNHEDKADKPRPPVLNTPKRFNSLSVLGSEGFSSGLHCWDVEVGNSTFWMLGVTTESIQRKEPNVFPRGAWGIGYDGEKLCARSPLEVYTPLTLVAKPNVVRIRLDMDLGEVWFLDPVSNTVIHVFLHQFTEKVFPVFHSMCSLAPLKILPLNHFVFLRDTKH